MTMEEILLQTQKATIDVHGTPVDFDDLQIKGGDFVLIKGRNGYGKSSFLKMLVGKDVSVKATKGKVQFPFLFGEKAMSSFSDRELAHLRNSIAYVPQEDDFLPTSSIFSAIYQNLKLTIEYNQKMSHSEKKEKKKECRKAVEDYLAHFRKIGLFDERKGNGFFTNPHLRSIYSCSGGQRKMCQIVTAIIQARILGSRLILMDEPLNNLDKNNKKILNNEIRDLMSQPNPPALLMVTHCHIFFGVNKEIVLEDVSMGRKATFREIDGKEAFFPCLRDGSEKDGKYELDPVKGE